MNKHVKNACIFASGAAVGFVVCGVSMVKIALETDFDKFYEFISDEETPKKTEQQESIISGCILP